MSETWWQKYDLLVYAAICFAVATILCAIIGQFGYVIGAAIALSGFALVSWLRDRRATR